MGIRTALAGMAAVVGVGALALQGSAVPAATNLTASSVRSAAHTNTAGSSAAASIAAPPAPAGSTPAASTQSSSSTSTPAAAAGAPVAAAPTTSAPAAAPSSTGTPAGSRCDDGPWRGPDGINVEGQPDGFDAGDRGAVYLWHGSDGWHLRTTDATNTPHHYTGTIALSPGSRFTSFSTVRLEREDRIWVDGDNVLHYDFTTYSAIDGLNFTVSACDTARDHEVLHFSMDYNGHEDDPARIALGDRKQHPASATFEVTRSV